MNKPNLKRPIKHVIEDMFTHDKVDINLPQFRLHKYQFDSPYKSRRKMQYIKYNSLTPAEKALLNIK